ncbi:glycosyltransferase family 4 protein [Halococcus sp. IIIV-5B]|uniref:glycosyltransferase family 4 protein n=1 Tax=Halococcus sp. IIIV-5B TaxID=2321230 RepID=UPI000E73AC6E|nr:glycosyltransferase family 4 protein [Halococcus sp. IIIV-5B]RJT07984.1 glycosyltransferase family 1 protein [Halococcus sp. IIIV-5B]
MKLLYVNNTSFLSDGGGGEERANEITKRLAARGHDITVVMGKTDPGLLKWHNDHGRRFRHVTCVPEFVFGYGSLGYFLSRYLFAFVSLPVVVWMLWREEFDAVVETMTPYPTFAVLAAKLFEVPIVATRHEFFDWDCYEVHDPLTATIQLLVQNFLRLFEYAALVVPTEHVKEEFVAYGVPEERLTVIPNGVEYERYQRPDIDTEEGRLVVVGRLTKRKRQDRLIHAVRQLRDDGYDVRLDILGDGPMRDRLERLIADLDLDAHVTMQGFVDEDEKFDLLNRAELFVFASTQEGFGIVLLEAMAAGLPIVAKYLPVYEDFFIDGENGYLLRDSNGSTDEFVAAVQDVLDSPSIRDEMKSKNLRTAERYSWSTVAARTETILATTIA